MTYDSKLYQQFIRRLSNLLVISNKSSVDLGFTPLNSARGNLTGFTIIELLVSFSLIAMISGIGFASFASYSRRQIVNQAALDMKQTVNVARFNAISSVKPKIPECSSENQLTNYKIVFCENDPTSCLSQDSDVKIEIIAACGVNERVVKTQKLPGGVMLENVNGANVCTTVTFDILTGITTGVPCEIYVEGYGNQFKVLLDSTGNASF